MSKCIQPPGQGCSSLIRITFSRDFASLDYQGSLLSRRATRIHGYLRNHFTSVLHHDSCPKASLSPRAYSIFCELDLTIVESLPQRFALDAQLAIFISLLRTSICIVISFDVMFIRHLLRRLKTTLTKDLIIHLRTRPPCLLNVYISCDFPFD